jgi:hypothetical protein
VTTRGGAERNVDSGRSIRLAEGTKINFGSVTGTVKQGGNGFELFISSQSSIPLAPGRKLTARGLMGMRGTPPGTPAAEVGRNPNDPAVLGLKNLSGLTWSVRFPAGPERQITPGRSVRLAAGTRIDFGVVEGEIQVPTPVGTRAGHLHDLGRGASRVVGSRRVWIGFAVLAIAGAIWVRFYSPTVEHAGDHGVVPAGKWAIFVAEAIFLHGGSPEQFDTKSSCDRGIADLINQLKPAAQRELVAGNDRDAKPLEQFRHGFLAGLYHKRAVALGSDGKCVLSDGSSKFAWNVQAKKVD